MFPRNRLLAFALAGLATLASVSVADAGWVTIRNDTNKAVVVQEYVVVNGKKMGGKPTKLLAGESFREFQNTPGVKCYEVLDAANTNSVLCNSRLNCTANSQAFAVTSYQGRVTVVSIPEPRR